MPGAAAAAAAHTALWLLLCVCVCVLLACRTADGSWNVLDSVWVTLAKGAPAGVCASSWSRNAGSCGRNAGCCTKHAGSCSRTAGHALIKVDSPPEVECILLLWLSKVPAHKPLPCRDRHRQRSGSCGCALLLWVAGNKAADCQHVLTGALHCCCARVCVCLCVRPWLLCRHAAVFGPCHWGDHSPDGQALVCKWSRGVNGWQLCAGGGLHTVQDPQVGHSPACVGCMNETPCYSGESPLTASIAQFQLDPQPVRAALWEHTPSLSTCVC